MSTTINALIGAQQGLVGSLDDNAPPAQLRAQLNATLDRAVALGLSPTDVATERAAIPKDDAALPGFVQQLRMSGESGLNQIGKPFTINQGPGVVGGVQDPRTGALKPSGAAVPLGLTPEQLLEPSANPPPMRPIPERPTWHDAEAALTLLNTDLLADFPFANEASRSVAMSMLMTPVLRAAMAVVPAHVITAPEAGTGKSYLQDIASAIAVGDRCAVMAVSFRDLAEEVAHQQAVHVVQGDDGKLRQRRADQALLGFFLLVRKKVSGDVTVSRQRLSLARAVLKYSLQQESFTCAVC